MDKLKHILLSRNVILALILVLLGSIFIGYVIPQQFTTSEIDLEEWKHINPLFAVLTEALGLHHMYTTPWFVVLLMIFLFILLLSTFEQVKYSHRATFGAGDKEVGHEVKVYIAHEQLLSTLKKAGYVKTFQDAIITRFIIHPWGYWGNVLLHLGIVVLVISSLVLVITEQRGLLHLVEGEMYRSGDPWLLEQTGMLADQFILPVSVRLDKVDVDYWETDDVRHISTVVSFIDKEGGSRQYHLGINKTVNSRGLRVYQGRTYGNSFYVEFKDKNKREFPLIIQIDHPRKRDKAGYGNFFVEGIPFEIKAKYYADAKKASMSGNDPLLVIRLVTIEQVLKGISQKKSGTKPQLNVETEKMETIAGEVSLGLGESGTLGPYTAMLVHVSRWSEIIFVQSSGMTGIFTGFIIIITGACFTYFIPPREFHARKTGNGYSVSWKASRFEKFYESEFEEIVKRLEPTVRS